MIKTTGQVKESRFPPSLFVIFFIVLLLMSGIHTGLIVLVNRMRWNAVIQTLLPMIYWGMVAVALTLFTRRKIRAVYEEPMHRLAEATSRVANGDFSVYVPATHTIEKRDYLDVMIMDFNKMVEELGSIETLKTDFVSNVSHEMKTPVAIIKTETGACDVSRQLCECILQYEDAWEEKGLGLALVKRVLELSDGNIQVLSEPGKGSTFVVTLPAAKMKLEENHHGRYGK